MMPLRRTARYLWPIFLVVAAGLLFWGIRPLPLNHLASPGALAAKFEETVFGNDSGPDIDRIFKWQEPYRISFQTPVPEYLLLSLLDYLPQLSRLTGLEMSYVGRSHSANVKAYYIDHASFTPLADAFNPYRKGNEEWMRSAACFFSNLPKDYIQRYKDFIRARKDYVPTPEDYIVEQGLMGIGNRLSVKVTKSCLLEELYQGLGPGKNTPSLRYSISHSDDDLAELSLNDKILLRTLYDDRITPGMYRTEAMKIAREVIKDLVAAVKTNGEAALIHPRYRARRRMTGG